MEHGNEKRNSLKASVQLISKEDPANKSGSLNYDINRDLDNTALTNSNKKKSRRLCGSAKKNEDTLKNNRNSAKNEEIQLNAINNNDNNKLVATAASAAVAENVTNKNQVKINLASIYDERQRQKLPLAGNQIPPGPGQRPVLSRPKNSRLGFLLWRPSERFRERSRRSP